MKAIGEITHRADGTKEYAVIVRSEHPEAIKALGVNVSSVFGDVIVVHVTLEELKNIVSLTYSSRSYKLDQKEQYYRTQ